MIQHDYKHLAQPARSGLALLGKVLALGLMMVGFYCIAIIALSY